ncbi:Helicase ATP-binding domain-containing protein [Balamuthia mandrillaris]
MQVNAARPQSVFNTQSNPCRDYIRGNCPELYPHQKEALLALYQHFNNEAPNRIALLVLPTGCGKTGIAALAPYVLNCTRVLVIAPSVIVANQLEANFCDPDAAFVVQRGIFDRQTFNTFWKPAAKRPQTGEELKDVATQHAISLVITNVQKIGAGRITLNDLDPEGFDLIIVDEAHHYPAPTWRALVDRFQESRVVFLTATDTYRGKYILGEAIQQDPPIEACFRFRREEAIRRGIIRESEFLSLEQQCATEQELAEALVAEVDRRLEEHDQQDPRVKHKALILAQSAEAGGLHSAHTIKAAYDSVSGDPRKCALFLGGTSNDVLDRFTKTDSPQVLVICNRLLEGFDHKPISVVGIHRNVAPQSKVLFTQFVGRCVRKCGNDDPVIACVISHSSFQQQRNFEQLDQIAEVDPEDEQE